MGTISRCPQPAIHMPADVQNIALPLRGSSFSSISPFLLMNRLLLSKQLQNGGLGPPGASPEGARKLPGTSLGDPGAFPRSLQSTTSAYLKRSTCPRELPGGPKVVLGAQKTPFAISRPLKVQASQLRFPHSWPVL